MVGSFGEVYLVDWGLAVESGRAPSEPGRLEGTPAYMAPEMMAGLPVDARTDVYLLGATLHEVLTGAPPHSGRTLAEVLESGYDPVEHGYRGAPAELSTLCREASLGTELLMIAGVCGAAGIVLARWWFTGLAAGLVGALLAAWNPALAGPAFTATAVLIASMGVVSWSLDARAPR